MSQEPVEDTKKYRDADYVGELIDGEDGRRHRHGTGEHKWHTGTYYKGEW